MVYLVRVNEFSHDGLRRGHAELLALTTSFEYEEQAVEWTLNDQDMDSVRDITVDMLSTRTDCWFQQGPDENQ